MNSCIVCGRRMPFEHDLFCSFGCKNKEEDKMSDNNAYIRYNDDAGVWQWSVSLVSDPENWLNSFDLLSQTLEFCQERGLVVEDKNIHTDCGSLQGAMADRAEELFWESRKDCPPGHYRCPACEVVVPDKDAHPISAHPYAPAVCGQCATEVKND